MNTHRWIRFLELMTVTGVWLGQPADGPAASPGTSHLRVAWTFDRDGDLEGWQPNAHLADVTATNGALSFRAVGADPIIEFQPRLNLPASPWQMLEVRLKADRDGAAEFFWSNTAQGRYGGFTQEKTTRFNVRGDNQWHTYRLLPFWHPETNIVRLRFDVFDGARFEIDSLRILELDTPPPAEHAAFDFAKGPQGWREVDAAGARLHLSPPLEIDTARNSFVSLRMTARAGAGPGNSPTRATLFFATAETSGLHSFTFPIATDAREHTYNVDLLDAANWRGHVIALGLAPVDPAAKLLWLRVSEAPQGPPQLQVKSVAVDDALPRVGRPVRLAVVVANTGAETATNLQLAIEFGGSVVGSSGARLVDRLGFDEETVVTWTVQSDLAGSQPVTLIASASNAEPGRAETRVEFTPRPAADAVGYVPEPKPVRGSYEVGAYYFPGWKTASQWHPLGSFPERRPVLGWYREGDPEVADWHIKWAVEHGLTFFAYDWYWSQGARQLEHALHDGYFHARYRHLLKFCLLWANHNPPRSSSLEDCLAVTRYWIENYFRRPEYLTIDGRPAAIVFSPSRLTEDLGSDGVRRAFDAMRAAGTNAGLKGLHLVACVGDAGQARQAAAEGYDAVTAYNWPHLGMQGEGKYAPFATLLKGYRRQWAHIREQSPIPLDPLPVCGGWDSRPWHGENNLVRFGRAPALLRQHLADARALLEEPAVRVPSGKPRLVLIEAWNEWGEGSYIEPHQEFGFGYLDAIREVFTDAPPEHADLAPADVGLGPYDVPPQALATTWEFEGNTADWNDTMALAEVKVANGCLAGRTTGNDPAFFGPPMQARSSDFTAITFRMRLTPADGRSFEDAAQLFWRTRRLPESEATSARFRVGGDGQWHDYRVPVAENACWRGAITRLRLDPCTRSGVQVDVDAIRLTP